MFTFAVIAYRLFFALLVIAAVTWQLADRSFGPGFSFVNFFSYFTILSNLFAAGVFIAAAWAGKSRHWFVMLRGAALVYMVTTGVIYALLLAPIVANVGVTEPWVDTVLHQIMPIVAVLDWLLVPPRMKLYYRHALLWLLFPLFYLIYSLIRGYYVDWYPYPFLNVEQHGLSQVLMVSSFIAGGLALFIWVVVKSGNALRRYAKTNPKHFPHFSSSNTPAVAWKGIRRRWLILFLMIIISILAGIFTFGVIRIQHNASVEASQLIAPTAYPNLHIQVDSYSSHNFTASAAYLVSGDAQLDNDIRGQIDEHFLPCWRQALTQPSGNYECQITVDVRYMDDMFLAFDYSINNSHQPEKIYHALYSLETKSRLRTTGIFKQDVAFMHVLTDAARAVLNHRFASAYRQDTLLLQTMQQTTAESSNFDNFWFDDDEKLMMTFQSGSVAPEQEKIVQIELPPARMIGILRNNIAQHYFPETKAQLEAEQRLSKEARQRAQAAEASRQQTRILVAPDRSNIDCAQMKCLALTFDDGPGPYTNQLLDILKTRRAVATFFVLGSAAARHPDILQRATNERNEIANHTWSHPNLTKLGSDTIAAQINDTNQAIFNAIGAHPKLMRPPYGAIDNQTKQHIGMPIAMWSIDTNDWRDRNPHIIYQRVVAEARSGASVLLHDTLASTVQAMPAVIDELQHQGYVLVTMSELLGITSENAHEFNSRILRGR